MDNTLSEISHLFLSSVREKQTGGAGMPRRRPPGQHEAPRPPSVDLSPEEFNTVLADPPSPQAIESSPIPPITAILASHLGAAQVDHARRYAKSLASTGRRVGLIAVDVAEFQLYMYDPSAEPGEIRAAEMTCLEPRAITDALNELSCDLDCWLLLAANPRIAEARSLLGRVDHWLLLSSSDHEGVVASYRTLKGLADLDRPRVALSVIDANDPASAEDVFRKLCGVCVQFLDWQLEQEPPVGDAAEVCEVHVMNCHAEGDKAQLASTPHWQVLSDFVEAAPHQKRGKKPAAAQHAAAIHAPQAAALSAAADEQEGEMNQPARTAATHTEQSPGPRLSIAPAAAPSPAREEPAVHDHGPIPFPSQPRPAHMAEVIDLPEGPVSASVVTAVMRSYMNELVECPIRPPMCPDARLAITRDRRIIIVAISGSGLSDLRSIGLAYRWVIENRELLAMALPQFALDVHQHPHLRLIVDHADMDAEVLQPIFQVSTVTIHTYRRVRWGPRTGLLLNAA